MRDGRRARWPAVLAAGALACLVWAVFCPIVGFAFVRLDVLHQLIHDSRIQNLSIQNLRSIFSTLCVTSYYPVRTLTFALDYQLWGLNPGGFKLTNGLIHLANVLLVFWLVLRLFRHPACADGSPRRWWDVGVATLAAGVFAVHPVVVEPVAWVGGREELLMVLAALGCFHLHVTARGLSERGRTPAAIRCHVRAAVCCLAACLSNAVAAVIPVLIVAWDVLTLTRPKWRKIVYGSSALWVISAATILIKMSGPDRHVAAVGSQFSPVGRVMLVLNVYWLNLRTLVWPANLAVHYPKVGPESFLDGEVILGGAALGLTGWILWTLRRQKMALMGVLWFGIALAPASQIVLHHVSRADRFLYLPLVGLALAAAASLRPCPRATSRSRKGTVPFSLRENRDSPRFAVGRLLSPLGNRLKGHRAVAVMVPGVLVLLLLSALSARQVQTWRDEIAMWENCLRVDPRNVVAHHGLATILESRGQYHAAISHYRAGLSIDPNHRETLMYFGLLLATCPKEPLRDYDLAVQLASKACELEDVPHPAALMILAEVYAQAGRLDMAIATTEEAVELTRSLGYLKLSGEFQERLELYQKRSADGRAP